MHSLTAQDYEQLKQRSVWTLLGLPSSLSWKVILLYLVPSTLSPIFIDKRSLGGSWPFWIALVIATDVIFAIVILVSARLIHNPNVVESKPLRTLLAFLVAQVCRGSFLGQVTVAYGLTSDPMLAYRIGYGSIFIVSALVISAILVALNDQNQTIAKSLMSATSRLQELNRTLQIRIDETNSNLLKYVQDNVNPRVQELDSLLSRVRESGDQAQAISDMSQYIETELRPLSHQLVREVSEVPALTNQVVLAPIKPRMPARINLAESVRPVVSAMLLLAALLSGATRTLDQGQRQHFALFVVPATFLIFWLLEKSLVRVNLAPITAALILLPTFSVVAPMLIYVRGSMGLATPTGVYVPAAISGGAIAAANLGYSLLIARRSMAIEDLLAKENELESALGVLRQHAWRARHRLAYVMHGSLLSALYAATIKLGQDPQPTAESIESIRNDISQALRKLVDVEQSGETFSEIQSRLSEVWDGVLHVTWDVAPNALSLLERHPLLAECTGEVIREALSNASRHGPATRATVQLSSDNESLFVRVSDNGKGIQLSQNPGLGLHLYDELCIDWTLSPAFSGGTVLEARVAVPLNN